MVRTCDGKAPCENPYRIPQPVTDANAARLRKRPDRRIERTHGGVAGYDQLESTALCLVLVADRASVTRPLDPFYYPIVIHAFEPNQRVANEGDAPHNRVTPVGLQSLARDRRQPAVYAADG